MKLLEVKNLSKYYKVRKGLFQTKEEIRALEDVSFTLEEGGIMAIVGESGSGKSTLARTLVRLEEKSKGEVFFQGRELFSLPSEDLRRLRPSFQLIFQDPATSLDPKKSVRKIILEAAVEHGMSVDAEALAASCSLGSNLLERHPDKLSGGEKARVAIARALALSCHLLILDESLSSLDEETREGITDLLWRFEDVGKILISHDLGLVREKSERTAVMFAGSFVEMAGGEELFRSPLHPYTRELLSRQGNPAGFGNPKGSLSGCPYSSRCPLCKKICKEERPEMRTVSSGHYVSCHLI